MIEFSLLMKETPLFVSIKDPVSNLIEFSNTINKILFLLSNKTIKIIKLRRFFVFLLWECIYFDVGVMKIAREGSE